jgi:protein-disulfide isomerase
MKNIFSILFIILLSFTTTLFAEDNQSIKRISVGEKNAKITIIAYESLTCGHCADFHKNVYPSLKKDFIGKGLVKIEFRHFPLDIAAFNASKIGQCNNDGNADVLNILFLGQKKWARGKTPDEAIKYLKNFKR